MKRIFIPLNTSIPLQRQIPNEDFIWGNYQFILSDQASDYDYIVVIDNIKKELEINCAKDNIILFTGEPPSVKIYPNEYLNQFGKIFTCQNNILTRNNAFPSIPPLPWMLGCTLENNSHACISKQFLDYNFFSTLECTKNRLNKICIITSNKKQTKGHRRRVNFATRIKDALPNLIDIYGNGFKHIDDKFEVLSKYRYTIVIENCAYKNYWTEKLSDAYLAGCYPLYYGAPNIESYFSSDEMTPINILEFDETIKKVLFLINNNIYEKKIEFINQSKIKVLNEYNMFEIIANKVASIEGSVISNQILTRIFPIKFRIKDKLINRIMRLI